MRKMTPSLESIDFFAQLAYELDVGVLVDCGLVDDVLRTVRISNNKQTNSYCTDDLNSHDFGHPDSEICLC